MFSFSNSLSLLSSSNQASFGREVDSRQVGQLDSRFVMPVRDTYTLEAAAAAKKGGEGGNDEEKKNKQGGEDGGGGGGEEEEEDDDDLRRRTNAWWRLDPRFSELPFMIAMEAGNRNLEQIVLFESVGFRRSSDLLRQVASALAHVHERGFVHCDAKPKNCVRLSSGRIVLIDCDAMLLRGQYFGERDLSSG